MLPDDYFEIGKSCYEKGQYKEAILIFTEAIKGDPNHIRSYFYRGMCNERLKQYEKAKEDYIKTIGLDINHDYAEAYYGVGNCLRNLNRADEAIKYYTKAIELEANYSVYHDRATCYSWLNKTEVNQALKDEYNEKANSDYKISIEYCTKEIGLNLNSATAYGVRGSCYGGLLQYSEGISDYTNAIRLDPNYAWAYRGRGINYYRLREYDNAIADLKKAVELNPYYLFTLSGVND